MTEGSVDVAELSLSCHNLRNKDWLSKSDPFVVVFVQARGGGGGEEGNETVTQLLRFQGTHEAAAPSEHAPERITCALGGAEAIWHYLGETEVVWNELSPYFVTKVRIPWGLVDQLSVRFEVYDMDNYEAPLAKQDFLGAYEGALCDVAAARNSLHALCDKKGRARPKMGSIRLIVDRYHHAPNLLATKLTLRIQIAANGGIDTGVQLFFVLLRAAPLPSGGEGGPKAVTENEEGAGWSRLHRSGAQASPATKREWTFQDVQLREDVLTGGDPKRFMRLELFIHRSNGRHQRVGGTRSFTLGMLRDGAMNSRQRLVPDVASGASLRSAEYAVDSAPGGGNGSPPRTNSASIFTAMSAQRSAEAFSPFRSSHRSSLKLSESEFLFRFANFVWWPAAKKDGLPGVLRTLSSRKPPS